ncbi:hypothetical protein VCRA2110O318_30030 [Vibrio crassostreae]|nr:hypothetical protein VCRA2110O318_30030 [Vibrio crassostreae]CAK2965912.1 hypothetical protein VCRA217O317_50218 [Vibrio crassostreae]
MNQTLLSKVNIHLLHKMWLQITILCARVSSNTQIASSYEEFPDYFGIFNFESHLPIPSKSLSFEAQHQT